MFFASFDFVDFWQMLADHWASELRDLGDWPAGTVDSLVEYIDLFPLVISLLWSIYGFVALFRARAARRRPLPARLPSYTVLIPFYAEPKGALRSALSLGQADPPPDEIILIDDGSPDGMGQIDVTALPPRTRVLRLEKNGGKAAALNAALREVRSEVIACLDADTVVHTPDWTPLLARFELDPEIGAVSGKIWPAEPETLAQRMQALDYLAVIGLVKNAEDQWGGLMTVSGAWVAFRRTAVEEAGGWNEATAAEDIDLSWRLQAAGWRLAYEGSVIAFVEMVPTWRGLWRQRRRWSRGLGRTVSEHIGGVTNPGAAHVPVAFLSLLGATWLWTSLTLGIIRVVDLAYQLTRGAPLVSGPVVSRMVVYAGIGFGFFFVQLLIASFLDRGPWRRYPGLLMLAPLYPLYFWAISLTTFVVGFPNGLLRRDRGRWRRTLRSIELATHTAPGELR